MSASEKMRADAEGEAVNRGAKGGRRDEDRLTIRFRGEERDQVMLGAARAGLSLASYVRALALGAAVPLSRKLSLIDAVQMAKSVAALNRIGSDLSQMASSADRTANQNSPTLDQALSEVRATLNELLIAAGRKRPT